MKKTPLFEEYSRLGGKIIDFGGWALPVQYTGIIEEHKRVREEAGLFDVSHMGEILVKGTRATEFIQKMVTNDISNARNFQIVYSPMCYHDGGIVDDLLIYKFNNEHYLLVVNASNTDKDFKWFIENQESGVEISNVSNEYAQIAIQGPKSEAILQKFTGTSLAALKPFHFDNFIIFKDKNVLVSRTGYTGEDGFEVYVDPKIAPMLWQELLKEGKNEGLIPAGLGARDTLRFEAALPLYGQEISKDISPMEAGLGRFVKFNKDDFIGKKALKEQKEQGIPRKLAGFEMIDRGVPRSRYEVQVDGKTIGYVTTGGFSPSLSKNIGLALIGSKYTEEGNEIKIIIRNKALGAKIVKTPFYIR
jgi:aminomethyltransferase